jgi:glycosyltransferase involved in cell wall biosynthesis
MNSKLVSLALICYNQAQFLESALEGVFSQTYSPLEILISDDASTDNSAEIIERCVNEYQGPHRIRIISPRVNGGLVANVNHVFQQAEGEVIVLAAGDDISLPNRVSEIVRVFKDSPSVMAVHSKTRNLAFDGTLLDEEGSPPPCTLAEDIKAIAVAGSVIVGATGAYRKCLYTQYGPIQNSRSYEDLVYGYRAALSGRLYFINEVLVQYRVGLGLSAHRIFSTRADRAADRLTGCLRNVAFLEQRLQDTLLSSHPEKNALQNLLEQEIRYRKASVAFYQDKAVFLRLLFSADFMVTLRVLAKELPYALSTKDINK